MVTPKVKPLIGAKS